MRSVIWILGFSCLACPLFARAALININTADAATLDTLPGIGPTKAQAIIEYRTAHGPFAAIGDIQNVSGIGPATFADIAAFITVGDSGGIDTAADQEQEVGSTTPAVTGGGGSALTYSPPPPSLSLDAGPDRTAFTEVPLTFTAVAKTANGVVDLSACVTWSFGDGSSAEGRTVEKMYRYAGTYLAVAIASDGSVTARDDVVIKVEPVAVHIVSVSSDGVTIANGLDRRLDLSGWRLAASTGSFRFPEGTMLLPNTSVFFPFSVMNMPITFAVSLTYPSGVLATQFPLLPVDTESIAPTTASVPSTEEKHFTADARYTSQAVESIISRADVSIHANTTVSAPAAAISVAAAGAALPVAPDQPTSTASSASQSGLLRSPWILGLVGVVALAGGVFIFL